MQEIIEIELPVSGLSLGMYVARLDRPWLGSGFFFQGFRIENSEQIEQLNERCKHVFVDLDRSHKDVGDHLRRLYQRAQDIDRTASSSPPLTRRRFSEWKPDAQEDEGNPEELNRFTATVYPDLTTFNDELEPARLAIEQFTELMQSAFSRLKADAVVDQVQIRDSVHAISQSMQRNPDALIWLSRLGKRDDYSFRHCINMSIWSIALGRQIGLPPDDLRLLGNGAIYCDLGKSQLPEAILQGTEGLDLEQLKLARKHVDHSLGILETMNVSHETIVTMVQQHHERYDGSGYPLGLTGHRIDLFARIIAIADTFDAMVSQRPYQGAQSVSAAVQELYRNRDVLYQNELVEEFIQSIGLYPAGSLVELNTGEVAIVVGESRRRRLRPRLMMLTDADKNHLDKHPTIDLMHNNMQDSGIQLNIRKDLAPGSYGLNPVDFFINPKA